MAGKKLVQLRAAQLEEIGEDRILELYSGLGSVRKLMNAIFEPHPDFPQGSVGVSGFYRWLENGGEPRAAWWRGVKKAMALADEERSTEEIMNIPKDASSDEIKRAVERAKHFRWLAKVRDRENYGDGPSVQVNNNTMNVLGSELAAALRQIEDEHTIRKLEADTGAPTIDAEVSEAAPEEEGP